MAKSQNGWQAIERGTDERLVAIPKVIGRVRAGGVATIFSDLVAQFDAHVEDVDQGRDEWGWAYREVRDGDDLSNHASGTAIDLNAMRHPIGRRGTFTPAQVAELRSILARYDGVVRWGGDYSGRKDEMHFEIVGNQAQVDRVAARLRGAKPAGTTPIAPVPVPDSQDDDMLLIRRASDGATFLVLGGRGSKVINATDLGAYQKAGVQTASVSDAGYTEAWKKYAA